MVEEAEGSQLEYAEDDEYHTPEVEEVPLPVCELRLIESPSVERLVNPFHEDECCRPRHPGVGGGQLVLAQPHRRTNPLWRTSFQF